VLAGRPLSRPALFLAGNMPDLLFNCYCGKLISSIKADSQLLSYLFPFNKNTADGCSRVDYGSTAKHTKF
jgi:hypothetical protein